MLYTLVFIHSAMSGLSRVTAKVKSSARGGALMSRVVQYSVPGVFDPEENKRELARGPVDAEEAAFCRVAMSLVGIVTDIDGVASMLLDWDRFDDSLPEFMVPFLAYFRASRVCKSTFNPLSPLNIGVEEVSMARLDGYDIVRFGRYYMIIFVEHHKSTDTIGTHPFIARHLTKCDVFIHLSCNNHSALMVDTVPQWEINERGIQMYANRGTLTAELLPIFGWQILDMWYHGTTEVSRVCL